MTFGSFWIKGLEVRILGEGFIQRDVQFRRNHLRDLVDFGVCHFQAAASVLDHAAGRHGSEGNDLRDVFPSVLLRNVIDDGTPAIHTEIDVDIRQRDAFGIQETFEEQAVLKRVDVGNAHAVRNQTSGCRTAARPDRDVVLARVPDEIPDDEKISGILHLLDDSDFALDARFVIFHGMLQGHRDRPWA